MRFNKKALGAVIATSLLISVSVLSIVMFFNWSDIFLSGEYVRLEKINSEYSANTGVEKIDKSILYFKNGYDYLNIISIEIGGIDCNVVTNLSKGIYPISIQGCAYSLDNSAVEVVVISDKGIFSKYLVFRKVPVLFYNISTDVDFSSSILNNVMISGSGVGAEIVLSSSSNNTIVTQIDDTSNIASPILQGGWNSGNFSDTVVTGSGVSSSISLNIEVNTIVYPTLSKHDGKFDTYGGCSDGRCGVDQFCFDDAYKPASAVNVHGFVSIDATDEIRDMPTNYGYLASSPVYWYRTCNTPVGELTVIDNDWVSMYDGFLNGGNSGTGCSASYDYLYSGTQNDGSLGLNCNGFTSNLGTSSFRWYNHRWNGITFSSGVYACDVVGLIPIQCIADLPTGNYISTGTYVSYVDSTSSNVDWNSFNWTGTYGSDSDVSIKVKGSSSSVFAPSFASGTCDALNQNSNGQIGSLVSCTSSSDRYLWYEVTLDASTDLSTTPTFDSVVVNVTSNIAFLSGNFLSDVKDFGSVTNLINLNYVSSTDAFTSLDFDIGVGNVLTPDGSWIWLNNVTSGTNIMSLSGNQYLQYRFDMSTTDESHTPTLGSVTISYD